MSTQTLTRKERKSAPRLRVAVSQLITGLRRDLFGGYRPELHYMRGPGPKWHAKHAPVQAAALAPGHGHAFA